MEEFLSLKWINHKSTFIHHLGTFRDKPLYTDATIACEGKFYSVHKLVLSTCSDYFSAIFNWTNCTNPIIILKDIKCEDLEALLDYMYLGAVNVRRKELDALMKAAECLLVKGLAIPDEEPLAPQKTKPHGTQSRTNDTSGSPPAKRQRCSDVDNGTPNKQLIESSPIHKAKGSLAPMSSLLGPVHSRNTPLQRPTEATVPPPSRTIQHNKDSNSDGTDNLTSNNQGNQSSDQIEVFVKMELDVGRAEVVEFFKEDDSYDVVTSTGGGSESRGDLTSDLPEFLQQAMSNPLQGGNFGHSSAGSTYQTNRTKEDLKEVLIRLHMQDYEKQFSDEGIHTINCLLKQDNNIMRKLVPKIGPRARLLNHLNIYRTQLDDVPDQDVEPNPQISTSEVISENNVDSNFTLISDSNDMSQPNLPEKCNGNTPHATAFCFEVDSESSDKCHTNTDTASDTRPTVFEGFDVSSENNASSVSCISVNKCSSSHMTAVPFEFCTKFSEQYQASITQADVTASHTCHPDSVVTRIYQKPNNDPACTDSIKIEINSSTYENSAKMARLENGAVFKDNKTLREFLTASKIGTALIELYKRKNALNLGSQTTFNQTERGRLVHLIIDGCLESDIEVKSKDLAYIADDIEQLFPNECKGAYYLPPSEGKKNASGKLVDFYFNSKRVLKKEKAVAASHLGSKFLDDSKETKEKVIWLKTNNHPWPKVEKIWNDTRGLRLQASEEGGTIHTYFEKWPILKEELGYRLLEADFNARYPNREMCLIESWRVLGAQLWKQCMDTKNKLLTIKGSFEEMSNNCDLRDALLLRSLATIFPPTMHRTKNCVWRPSLAECQDAYIMFVEEEKDIDSALQKRRANLSELGVSMQPLIVAVKSDSAVTNLQVVIDSIKYPAFSTIEALDMLMKIIMAADIPYSVETKNFFMFLQLKSFNVSRKHDKMAPSVSTMLKKL